VRLRALVDGRSRMQVLARLAAAAFAMEACYNFAASRRANAPTIIAQQQCLVFDSELACGID